MTDKTASSIDDIIRLRASYEEKLQTVGQPAIRARAQQIFDAFPECVAITWDQYTPYFSDGDSCTFSVHDMWLMNDEGLKEFEEEGGCAEEYSMCGNSYAEAEKAAPGYKALSEKLHHMTWSARRSYVRTPEEVEQEAQFRKVWADACEKEEALLKPLNSIPDDVMCSVFGDHVQVTIRRDSQEISVDECDHD